MRALPLTAFLMLHSCAHHPHFHDRFDDPHRWEKEFEAADRDAWQRPDEVLAALALPPDACAADIGSATGYFSVRLSRALPQGKVYGIDIEPTMVEHLRLRAAREGLGNLTSQLGAPDDPRIPEPCDLALVVNTFHHLEHRPAYFRKVAAQLKPSGRVAIIDFTRQSPRGPPEQFKLDAAQIRKDLHAAGFDFVKGHPLPDQHFLIFQRTR